MNLNIKNEYDKLLKVILAPVGNEYLDQQNQLIEILKKYNVQILMSEKCNDSKYQMFIRDPFVVVDNKILIVCMKDKIRKLELNTIEKILDTINYEEKIILNDDTIVEGGDIIIHNKFIFVGQNGNRTNKKGLEFIKEIFGNKYKIISLNMINPNKEFIPFVHLDCLFNPISSDTVILYREGFDNQSFEKIEKIFPNIIYINSKEQDELASNVFSLGNKTVIMQERHSRLINILKKYGFKIETMNKYNTIKETGYIRCLTCPLERK